MPRGSVIHKLGDIFELLSPNGKMVVSSRTEFFLDAVEERQSLLGTQRPQLFLTGKRNNAPTVRSLDKRSEIAHLRLLVASQVHSYVKKRMYCGAKNILLKIKNVYNLRDIARRPVLLDMICETVPLLDETSRQIFAADLYEAYIQFHLTRDTRTKRVRGKANERILAIGKLAEYMLVNNTYRIHHKDIKRRVRLPKEDNKRDFLCSSFLIRDDSGVYRFSHRSFLEYFGALRMFMSLSKGHLTSRLWQHECSDQQWEFLEQMVTSRWFDERLDRIYRRNVCTFSNGLILDRCPVSVSQYNYFRRSSSYKPFKQPKDIQGYAGVTWFDAVAYSLWRGGRILEESEMCYLINSEWPHSFLSFQALPRKSFYAMYDTSWGKKLISKNGLTILLGKREWTAWYSHMQGTWIQVKDERVPVTYGLTRDVAKEEQALFRCAYTRTWLGV